MRLDHPLMRLGLIGHAIAGGAAALRGAIARRLRVNRHEEALRRAVLTWRWQQLDERSRRRARRLIARTRRRYPWALNLEASIASPVGMGNDGQKAYDMATRTWFGNLVGQVLAAGKPVFDVTNPSYSGGAKGDGITNDTAAIKAADAAAEPVHGIVYFPQTLAGQGYLVTGTGTEIFLLTHSTHWVGSGFGAVLLVATGTGAGVDVIRVSPATATNPDGAMYLFEDFRIVAQSGAPARHAFRFEPTVANSFLRAFNVSRVWTDPFGGNSVSVANTGGFVAGAIFTCQLENSTFGGGLDFTGTGDSVSVTGCTIASIGNGVNAGAVTVNLVAGAGQFYFEDNNFVGAGGLQIRSAIGARIRGNNLQLSTAFTGAGAFVNLAGDVAGLINAEVTGNIISVLAGGGAVDALRVAAATSTQVDGNYFFGPGGNSCINVTAAAVLTYIGFGNSYQGAATPITDAGTATTSYLPSTRLLTLPGGIYFNSANPRIRGGVADLGFLNHAGSVQTLLITDAGDVTITRGGAFWGHAAVGAQPAAPVTLADVIAIIRGCGLSA